MPKRRRMTFTETVSSHTSGAKRMETKRSIPDMPSAIFSARRMAMRLGMSSPKTMLKYESTKVMRIMQMVLSAACERGTPAL